MSTKSYTNLVPGNPITSTTLNTNFSNLADLIDTVDNEQILHDGISWDSCEQVVAGASTFGTTSYHPIIGAIVDSPAKVINSTVVTKASSPGGATLTDGTNDFTVSLDPSSSSIVYSMVQGDCIRYWFNAEVIPFNTAGALALDDQIVFYPEFNVYISGTPIGYTAYWPTPSGDYYSPASIVGCAARGKLVDYPTVRSASGVGRGPGVYQTVCFEGIFPIKVANVTRVDIRIRYRMNGTNEATVEFDLMAASFQSMLFKNAWV